MQASLKIHNTIISLWHMMILECFPHFICALTFLWKPNQGVGTLEFHFGEELAFKK